MIAWGQRCKDYSEITLANFESVCGTLPDYADPDAKWYVHKKFFWTVMANLALAAGGANAFEITAFPRDRQFLGYPVEFTRSMPRTEANSQVCALFGDLRRAGMLGDRRKLSIDTDRSVYFVTDKIATRATERLDIVIHDVGNESATESLRVAGPIVGLITAAS